MPAQGNGALSSPGHLAGGAMPAQGNGALPGHLAGGPLPAQGNGAPSPWPPCWWCHAGAMQWRSSRPPCWWCCAGVLVISTFIYLVAGRGRKAVVLGVSICIYLAAVGDGSTWHKYLHISVDSSCW